MIESLFSIKLQIPKETFSHFRHNTGSLKFLWVPHLYQVNAPIQKKWPFIFIYYVTHSSYIIKSCK